MTEKMKSFVKGILLGLFGHPLPQGEKEPVAYLYNGVRMPDIYKVYTPELQKTHPYALMYGHTFDNCLFLWVSAEPWECRYVYDDPEVPEGYFDGLQTAGEGHRYMAYPTYTEWEYFVAEPPSGVTTFRTYFQWTNHDIVNPDGTVYLAATEPVPVYE